MENKPEEYFHPKTTLDKFFEVGILLKALDGLIETVGGLLLLIIRPEHIVHWAKTLTNSELKEDPHDFIASHIVHWANGYTHKVAIFAAVYLLAHGLIKVILVFEVLRNHLWAYVALIVVTFGFVVYQIYELVNKFSFGFTFLTIFDLAIIYLTSREYQKRRQEVVKG